MRTYNQTIRGIEANDYHTVYFDQKIKRGLTWKVHALFIDFDTVIQGILMSGFDMKSVISPTNHSSTQTCDKRIIPHLTDDHPF